MLFVIKIFIAVCYFLIRMYAILDNKVIYSKNGSKLEKYITQFEPVVTSSNFGGQHNQIFVQRNLFFRIIHFLKYKQDVNVLLITIAIISIEMIFLYKYFVTNFCYLNIFSKNIDLVTLFYPNFKKLVLIYLVIFSFCVNDIIKNIKIYIDKVFVKSKKEFSNIKKGLLYLGHDKFENDVCIQENGLYQNILITGSIGTGKTSSCINSILANLIQQNEGGLVIDVKGNYLNTIRKMCKKYGRENDIVEISLESDFKYNPLDNDLSTIELSHMLKKVLLLLSDTNVSDSFWIDKVEGYLRDFITLIRINLKYASFLEIHNMVNDDEYLKEKIERIKNQVLENKFSDEELFNIQNAIKNIKNEYFNLDERTKSIIKAEITRITSIFVSDYAICNKFCYNSDVVDFYSGKIIVLSIGIGKNSMLAKVISTYLKLEFQRQVLSQNSNYKSVFFVCDEYQELANKEDAHFFSVSREFKCINVVSMQSYSSLINALKDEVSSRVIIQNLVNKIWFRNNDNYTVSEIIKQIGKEEKKYENLSVSENGSNTRYSIISNKFKDYKTGITKSYSYNLKLDYKYNEEYFTTNLNTFEAACLLSDGNSMKFVEKVKFKIWEDENDKKSKKSNDVKEVKYHFD